MAEKSAPCAASIPTVTRRQTYQNVARGNGARVPQEPQAPELHLPSSDMNTTSDGDLIIIDPFGDVVLQILDEAYPKFASTYRVNASTLRTASRYFRNLLDPQKFHEGLTLEGKLNALLQKYPDLNDAPPSALPTLSISSIGQIGKVNDPRKLLRDFLLILHWDTGVMSSLVPKMPLSNLANLVIVADHFDSLDILKIHAHKNKLFSRVKKGETSPRRLSAPMLWDHGIEEIARMRIMIGLLLGYQPWVQETQHLIIKGSKMWQDCAEGTEEYETHALWWNLPQGLEEELRARRDAIIDTLASIQDYFLQQYASSEYQQCKFGYTSSRNCDIYQLGELVRFFHKLGIVSLRSTMAGHPAHDPFEGDIDKAIRSLRQVPSYQIDKDHGHCGPHDPILQALDTVQMALSGIAVCGACWDKMRQEVKWRGAKAPVWTLAVSRIWRSKQEGSWEKGSVACAEQHSQFRDLFLVKDKIWARNS